MSRVAGRELAGVLVAIVLLQRPAWAGMPTVTLSDIASMRVEAISFFLVCFLITAKIIQRIWNGLRTDFPNLPILTYRNALGAVTVWAFLFLLVLSMISDARELMTPGAWTKTGLTYRLDEKPPEVLKAEQDSRRRAKLERLHGALWTFAQEHGGILPDKDERSSIPHGFWRLADEAFLEYVYIPGLKADSGNDVVAFEPGVYDEREVLLSSGVILRMTQEQLDRALPKVKEANR